MATAPIDDDVTRNDYVATSGQTTFPYTFWIKDDDDLDVYKNGTLLTKTTHYTVSTTQNVAGGNVVLTSGATLNDDIAIVYNPPIDRQSEFQTSGSFRAAALNLELTYITSLLQFLRTKLGRAVKLADDTAFSGDLNIEDPTGNAGKALVLNATEDGLEYGPDTSSLASDISTATTAAATATTQAGIATTQAGLAAASSSAANAAKDAAESAAASINLPGAAVDVLTDVELLAIAGLTSAANKVPMFSGSGTATLLDFKDEDNMASNSATAVPSQQSVKAYVDANAGASPVLDVKTAANDSAITFIDGTDFDFTAAAIEIEWINLVPASDAACIFEVSVDGGSNWLTTGNKGHYSYQTSASPTSLSSFGKTTNAATLSADASVSQCSGKLIISNLKNASTKKLMQGWSRSIDGSADKINSFFGGDCNGQTSAINAFRIRFNGQNTSTGTVIVSEVVTS